MRLAAARAGVCGAEKPRGARMSSRKPTALLGVGAPGAPGVDAVAATSPRAQQSLADLERHVLHLQSLLTQTQLAYEYVNTENEQLRLALAPDIEPEPVRITVQLDDRGAAVELEVRAGKSR